MTVEEVYVVLEGYVHDKKPSLAMHNHAQLAVNSLILAMQWMGAKRPISQGSTLDEDWHRPEDINSMLTTCRDALNVIIKEQLDKARVRPLELLMDTICWLDVIEADLKMPEEKEPNTIYS